MSISYISTVEVQQLDNASSTTITIPNGATFCLIGLSWWQASPGFSSNAITLDGQSAVNIFFGTYAAGHMSTALYTVSGFSTGAGKTFAWDFSGSTAVTEGCEYMLMFFSGVDTADPIRDFDSVSTISTTVVTITTPSIDSSDTDMMAGFCAGFTAVPDMDDGVQSVKVSGTYHSATYACATKVGASPNATMTADARQAELVACSLKAEGVVCDDTTQTQQDTQSSSSSQSGGVTVTTTTYTRTYVDVCVIYDTGV